MTIDELIPFRRLNDYFDIFFISYETCIMYVHIPPHIIHTLIVSFVLYLIAHTAFTICCRFSSRFDDDQIGFQYWYVFSKSLAV